MKTVILGLIVSIILITSCSKSSTDLSPTSNQVKDYDGNVYDTVVIGTQTWMVENLKTTHYRNGVPIPHLTDSAEWANDKTGAYCDYNNSAGNGNIYGHLYNWYAVNNPDSLCPVGWHIPAETDWHVLIKYLDPSADTSCTVCIANSVESNIAGGAMKSTGTTFWTAPNNGATNSSGFTALPAGTRSFNGTFGTNIGLGPIGVDTDFWSSTSDFGVTSGGASAITLNYINPDVSLESNYVADGFSCRCVKN